MTSYYWEEGGELLRCVGPRPFFRKDFQTKYEIILSPRRPAFGQDFYSTGLMSEEGLS
jgi:hypothetical protein